MIAVRLGSIVFLTVCLASLPGCKVSMLSSAASALAGASAGDACTDKSDEGKLCRVQVEKVHPTQFAIGMREVESKRQELKSGTDPEAIPIVIGPDGAIFVIDHHHLALAMLELNIRTAKAQVLKNWSDKSHKTFWQKMQDDNWVYLYDENGQGPLSVGSLPSSLLGMKDDPYRSLAWAVREAGGFVKTDKPFTEFKWAEFFRLRMRIEPGQSGWEASVQAAMVLAKSPEAAGLPGAHGK